MARRPTLWFLGIDDFDKMPKEARQALANTRILGTARDSQGLRIARAPGATMAARIYAADEVCCSGDNMARGVPAGVTAAKLNAILQGKEI